MNDINMPQTLEIRDDFKIYDYVSFNKRRSTKTETLFESENSESTDEVGADLEVTDDTDNEQDPQASQTPPEDKRKLPLFCNRNFYNLPVNTNHSAVHVPSNVYERCKWWWGGNNFFKLLPFWFQTAKEVIKGIKWSEELDKTFRNNYKEDPTLSWQYFGSSTGFMRQFPGKTSDY